MVVKKELLIHWWHYYGKAIYTLAELEEFEKIIDDYGVDKVCDAAVATYVCGDSSPTIILMSIRKGAIEELFESLPDISKMGGEEQKEYQKMRENFVKEISQTA